MGCGAAGFGGGTGVAVVAAVGEVVVPDPNTCASGALWSEDAGLRRRRSANKAWSCKNAYSCILSCAVNAEREMYSG